jgi:hypothetical protein
MTNTSGFFIKGGIVNHGLSIHTRQVFDDVCGFALSPCRHHGTPNSSSKSIKGATAASNAEAHLACTREFEVMNPETEETVNAVFKRLDELWPVLVRDVVNAIFNRLGKELPWMLLAAAEWLLGALLLWRFGLLPWWRSLPSNPAEALLIGGFTIGLLLVFLAVLGNKLPRSWWWPTLIPILLLWVVVPTDGLGELKSLGYLGVSVLSVSIVAMLWAIWWWQQPRSWLDAIAERLRKVLVAPTFKRVTLAIAIGVLMPLIVARGNISGGPEGDAHRGTLLESLVIWGALPDNFHTMQIALLIASMFLVAIGAFVVLGRVRAMWNKKRQQP